MALQSSRMVSCPLRAARVMPFTAARRTGLRLRAEAETNSAAAAEASTSGSAQVINFKNFGVLSYPHTDAESFKDVFAFGGSAPERVNGRVAMLGFVAAVAAEAANHTSVVDQLASGWPAIVFLQLLLTAGSIAPKFVTGRPLSQLHAAATNENLAGEGAASLGFFSAFTGESELWTGRIAMLGFAGLVANEIFLKGGALF